MLSLIDFVYLNDEQKLLVFKARYAASSLLTYKKTSFNAFLNFIKYLKFKQNAKYFMLLENDDFIGVIGFYDIKNSSAKIAFYKNTQQTKVGKIIINELLKKAKNLEIKTLFADVKVENSKALSLLNDFEFYKIQSKNAKILTLQKNI